MLFGFFGKPKLFFASFMNLRFGSVLHLRLASFLEKDCQLLCNRFKTLMVCSAVDQYASRILKGYSRRLFSQLALQALACVRDWKVQKALNSGLLSNYIGSTPLVSSSCRALTLCSSFWDSSSSECILYYRIESFLTAELSPGEIFLFRCFGWNKITVW